MNIEQAIELFRKNYVGQYVRAQLVDYVEISVDTNSDDKPRWFLRVLFRENPASDESPEENLLQRIYSEIPTCASVLCGTWQEAVEIIERKVEGYWLLEDEIGIASE